jgi:Fe2+ transport system protein FeoA
MNDLSLIDVPLSGKGRVKRITLPAEEHRRLLEMGLTRGSEFEVVRYAPLGDPLEIRIRGYNLSLRRSEAKAIAVELIP